MINWMCLRVPPLAGRVCVYPLESQGSFWIRDFFMFFLLQQGPLCERERERAEPANHVLEGA